jgi:hypothetical protein
MLGKVKQYFGIEGIKIKLEVPELIDKRKGLIEGHILLSSMHTQTARSFRIRLVEKYHRGRRRAKLINEYVLGEIELKKNVVVSANTTERVPFKLPFQQAESRMDQMENNLLLRGLVRVAKFANAVKSEYRLEAEADVAGTALDPSHTVKVRLR